MNIVLFYRSNQALKGRNKKQLSVVIHRLMLIHAVVPSQSGQVKGEGSMTLCKIVMFLCRRQERFLAGVLSIHKPDWEADNNCCNSSELAIQ